MWRQNQNINLNLFKFLVIKYLRYNLAALKCEFSPNKDFKIVSEEYLNG